jgi:hypothetical protein
MDYQGVDERPELAAIRQEYIEERRAEAVAPGAGSLANQALRVVLEWGPAKRLPEAWRLEQRAPGANAADRESALANAHYLEDAAYALTAEAWPHDRREIAADVDRVAAAAMVTLASRYSEIDADLLRRAISQANYYHAK